MSVASAVGDRLGRVTWVQRALLSGLALAVVWTEWTTGSLTHRMLKDVVVYIYLPAALAVLHGRRLGWRVDRRAVRNAVLLALFVLPFYVVGSTLPSVRAYYPMWGGGLDEVLVHPLLLELHLYLPRGVPDDEKGDAPEVAYLVGPPGDRDGRAGVGVRGVGAVFHTVPFRRSRLKSTHPGALRDSTRSRLVGRGNDSRRLPRESQGSFPAPHRGPGNRKR